MSACEYGMSDFKAIAAGAAMLSSGGGYQDALAILEQLADSGWQGTVKVQDYDGATNSCVLAIMGSPDAANGYALSGSYIANTLTQAGDLGLLLLKSAKPLSTAEVVPAIGRITGRTAMPVVTNSHITAVTQSTSKASLDSGIIRVKTAPQVYQAAGVVASFASLPHNLGYAGAMPSA